MPPKYTQNAAHRAAQAEVVGNNLFAASGALEGLAAAAKVLDATRPEGFGVPPLADLYKEMIAERLSDTTYTSSLAQIERTTPDLLRDIFSNWDRLRAIIAEHKPTIKHRWEKRTAEKRKVVLVEAWGKESKIPPRRRPNFDAYKSGFRGGEYKWTYLIPAINLEDLSDKTNIILFLESRASYEPSVFAWADTKTVLMANESGVKIPDTYGYNMLLTGEPRDSYGSIVSWGDNIQSMAQNWTAMYEGKNFHLGQGFTCLEIQRIILTFLVRVCELLLADMERNVL